MTFADTSILVGLAALAIPLLVHLWGRRRPRRVVLPTARFAEGAHLETVGRRRLERAALLALRLAAVALLVLAVAGPRLGRADGSGAAGPVVEGTSHYRAGVWAVCLDASPSMGAADDGESRYERAKQSAAGLLARLADGEEVVLVCSGEEVRRGSPAHIRAVLEAEALPTAHLEPIGSLVARAAAAIAPAAGAESPARLVVLTDATPWALRDLGEGQFKDLAAEVVLVPVGGETKNGHLALPRVEVLDTPEGRRLLVETEAVAGDPSRGATVHLALEGAAETFTAEAGPGAGRARFVVAIEGDGPWQGRLWMDGRDALALDNERFFTAVAPVVVRVLVVDASDERGGARSADLVRATFAGRDPAAPKEARGMAADALAEEDLKSADVVFWVGPSEAGRAGALREYVAGGGAVVWVPAEAAAPEPPLADLLGVQVGGVQDAVQGVTMDPGAYTSALVAALEGGTSGDLSRPVFRRRLVLRPREAAVAVRFMDGLCAIADRRLGKGRAVTLAVGPAQGWGDLATRPEFVVLAHSLVEASAPGASPRAANRVVGRAAGPAEGDLGPGHFAGSAAGASGGWKGPFSVNVAAEETADLVPRPERLASAFAPERSRLVRPEEVLGGSGTASASGGDASAWFVAPLLAAVLLETYLSGSSRARAGRSANRS
ncbi:MAG TPA: BatA domain-containing protein [Phycisphaerae bacterium]|nr:BatA domain-containing protein [Phycisphaerae bacterium]